MLYPEPIKHCEATELTGRNAENEDNSWHKCAAYCEKLEVSQLANSDLEGRSASFVSMTRKTHDNAESLYQIEASTQ